MHLSTQKITGENLKALRTTKGLSQTTMAQTVGLTRSLYTQYELGKRTPDAEALYHIALCFGIEMSAFFESNSEKFIRQIYRISGYDQAATDLINNFNRLTPFSQGRLLEYSQKLFEWDTLKYENEHYLESRKACLQSASVSSDKA